MALLVAVILGVWTGWTDFRENRIANLATFPAMLIGVILWMVTHSGTGLAVSAAGLLFGGAVLFLPFVFGGVGAGDVKLLGAFGALCGWPLILESALYGFVVGGMMAAVVLARDGRFWKTLGWVLRIAVSWLGWKKGWLSVTPPAGARPLTIPMGCALAVGALIAIAKYGWYQFR